MSADDYSEAGPVGPLSAYRINYLMRLGNKLAGGDRAQTDLDAIAEVYFVCSAPPDELARMKKMPREEWDEQVELFHASLSDGALEKFSEWLKEEFGAIEESTVEQVNHA